jgi:D-tyrosyl-tRNA(Tyr) deacylase
MRAIVQRVSRATVAVDGSTCGEIGVGLVVLAAAHRRDLACDAEKLANRIYGLRIFNDCEGRINLALKDLPAQHNAAILAISNFTVYGETAKNRRPSFVESAAYENGEELFGILVSALKRIGARVETGEFGANMQVELVNDGPVTVIVEAGPSGP